MIRSCCLLALLVAAPAVETSMRSDGTLLVAGRPFLPLGVYYNARWRTSGTVAGDLQTIAAAGLNCVELSQIQAWSDPDGGLAACGSAGLKAFLEVGWDSNGTAAWAAARTNVAAVAGWNLADDSHRRFTTAQMAQFETAARAAVPNQILYQTVYDSAVMGPYLGYTDTTWAYRYPVYNLAEGKDTSAVHSLVMDGLQDSGVPFMAIPQAYRWDDDATHVGNRFPTAREYRGMAWQGLCAGAKGLIPYAMTDTTGVEWLPDGAPALWSEITATAGEVSAIRWVICDGVRTRLDTGTASTVAAVWRYHGGMLIAVTRCSSSSGTVNLAIPSPPAGPLVAVGRTPAAPLTWNGSVLSGSLAAAETQLFRLGSIANAAPAIAGPATVPSGAGTALTLASDADGDGLTVIITSGPSHGTLSGSGATRTYTPTAGYTGSDSITVAVHDGWLDASGSIAITVQGGNSAPVVGPATAAPAVLVLP